ncbi:YqgE/AlgH family protein [Marinicella rhabdoformis]|uniref:YqgE/AlgH family protein n=1 Tax=Marinicella rhabdoformis TaxID=2580566 RepID=UPI0012AEDF7C|nr:YqgE/AlgH family protein [Marinicella rhabdoformis]
MNLINQFLIATPDMADERFKNAVILICDHNEDGAMGLNINQPSDVTFEDILSSLSIENLSHQKFPKVHEGGPVNSECGFILHKNQSMYTSSISVSDQLALTTSKDVIRAIANKMVSEQWLMALGCATWTAGQLEQEIADNAWLTCPADERIIFNQSDNKWASALDILGIKAHQLTSEVGHA